MVRIIILFLVFTVSTICAQSESDKEAIEATCMNYIEGFYEGKADKLKLALMPSLQKLGYWQNKEGNFGEPITMTYEGALEYADDVLVNKKFAKPGAVKKVEVLDVLDFIAAAKVTAWWGYDYVLLSKKNGTWKIEEVLWQGPLKKEKH